MPSSFPCQPNDVTVSGSLDKSCYMFESLNYINRYIYGSSGPGSLHLSMSSYRKLYRVQVHEHGSILESRALSSSHVSSVDDVRPISYTPLSNCPTIDIIIISNDHVVSWHLYLILSSSPKVVTRFCMIT